MKIWTHPPAFFKPFANTQTRMNRRKADFKFAYKFLEDDV